MTRKKATRRAPRPLERANPTPPPSTLGDATGFYVRVPPELVPPELVARAAEHVERARELVGILFDLVAKTSQAHAAVKSDVRRLRRPRGR
ncbi:MAG: hypothetical protein EBS48_09550 [Actinobacteria bacterium]|nr:hypothetical protein [Actinomycetota bacterium]